MDIPPDTKDWTWVLTRPCEECGFDPSAPDRAELPAMAEALGTRWLTALQAPGDVRERPDPIIWSRLEYACHVRDVFDLADYRIHLMLEEDRPQFANWDQDATAVEKDYNADDPDAVGSQIVERAAVLASTLEVVGDEQWHRQGFRSDGAVFTVETFTRYLLHDPIHHLTDVTGERWSGD